MSTIRARSGRTSCIATTSGPVRRCSPRLPHGSRPSEGRIAQYDLAVLEDPRHAIPPYDAILLVAPKRTNDRALIDALRPLVGAIDVNLMRAANQRATSGGGSPEAVARWLWEQIERRK